MNSDENSHHPFLVGAAKSSVSVTLPPTPLWSGASNRFVADKGHPRAIVAEISDFTETADLDQTRAWLESLAADWPQLHLSVIGHSAGEREIVMATICEGDPSPQALRASGKTIVVIQAGIHPGEIDGKDAMLMHLRDMASGENADLLSDLAILFIPILNVDGYARFHEHQRINQRGPRAVGWSTNDLNLNLNRDFGKLDAPETRAVVDLFQQYDPDLYIDTHVTDGADYQYDVTFGHTSGPHAWSPTIAQVVGDEIVPKATAALEEEGHIPGPLTLSVNDRDMSSGRIGFTANLRFATGAADLHHIPSILVENHSLKPFRQRVLGMYVLLSSLMSLAVVHRDSLRKAKQEDRRRRQLSVPLGWAPDQSAKPVLSPFKGVRAESFRSSISGQATVRWTGEPDETPVAVIEMNKPIATAVRPDGYIVPAALKLIADRIKAHGATVTRLGNEGTREVEQIYLPTAALHVHRAEFGIVGTGGAAVSEGHVRVDVGAIEVERISANFRAQDFYVPTDQPLGDLVSVLLEPGSPDSFFQWGFMLHILEQTAHSEPYVLEPLAQQMLDSDPALAQEFEALLKSDDAFANDPDARLDWFLQKTPYRDFSHRLYPIFRTV